MPMSAETKERLRQARLAKVRAPKTEAEPIVTHETDDEWIEVTVRIKRPSGASRGQ